MKMHQTSYRINKYRVYIFIVIVVSIALSPVPILFAQDRTPVGLWKTVSDNTGEATSFVCITLENETLVGIIEKLIRKPGQNPNPLCTECPDEKKDQPIQGLTILSVLTQDGGEWNGGIYPGSGQRQIL